MTPEKQRIAIAEARGPKLFVLHKPIHDPFGYYRKDAHGYTSNIDEAWKVTAEVAAKYTTGRHDAFDRVIAEPAPIPDYLNDLNAMHEAEKTLTMQDEYLHGERAQFIAELCKIYKLPVDAHAMDVADAVCHATAAQRAEAFLRTIGKWEDGQ